MKKLISVDMRSAFGHLKKNDMNDGISLTYTYLHKPALLGIFGAIIGLGGYSQAFAEQESVKPKKGEKKIIRLPQYYTAFRHLRLSVGLTDPARGTFAKTIIGYNNSVGYANNGATLQISEQTLVCPEYRVYVELDTEQELERKLYESLLEGRCEFIPYLGKNDFTLHWKNPIEYDYQLLSRRNDIRISSLFLRKDATVKQIRTDNSVDNEWEYVYDNVVLEDTPKSNMFMFLETLPHSYHDQTGHYVTREFAYTNWTLKLDDDLPTRHLYEISNDDYSTVIQLY